VFRLLVLCRGPYHLRHEQGEAWLREQLESVLRRDGLGAASLTGLDDASPTEAREWDWLIEVSLAEPAARAALGRGGACSELLADMRLLGMAPTVALAADPKAIDPRPS
jgi:hypothetical protein